MNEETTAPQSVLSEPGEGPPLKAPAGTVTVRARAEQTGGTLTACESAIPPGEGPPIHVHVREDELMYVVEGHLEFELDGARRDGPAGTFVFIPRGTPHSWRNVGSDVARVFFAFTPGSEGMEGFFERAAESAGEVRGPESFRRFARDAGMQVLGPPLG
jgi:quercetin dioxygenase-like cupin family protein